MNTLVIYDSKYGNTAKIAKVISDVIRGEMLIASDVDPSELPNFDLLIIGSPTHGGFPSKDIDHLLKAAPKLSRVRVAAFDTRTKTTIFGYAAPKIAKRLIKIGGQLVEPSAGFLVLGTEGPLSDGEVQRAESWAKGIADSAEFWDVKS